MMGKPDSSPGSEPEQPIPKLHHSSDANQIPPPLSLPSPQISAFLKEIEDPHEYQVGRVLLEYMRLRNTQGEIDTETEQALIQKLPEDARVNGRELLLTAEVLMWFDPEALDTDASA